MTPIASVYISYQDPAVVDICLLQGTTIIILFSILIAISHFHFAVYSNLVSTCYCPNESLLLRRLKQACRF